MARQRIDAAQAELVQARATWWPQLQLQSGYWQSDNPMAVFGATLNQRVDDLSLDFDDVPDTDNLNVRGVVTLPLYAGGRETARRAGAKANLEAHRWEEAAVAQTLDFEVIRAWFSVRQAAAFVVAAEASVHAFVTHRDLAAKRLAEGAALKTDVLDLEVRLAQAREELLRVRNALERTQRILGNLLGREDELAQVAEAPVALEVPLDTRDFSGRPELSARGFRTAVAEAELRQARGGHYPRLEAFGAVDYDHGWRNDAGAASYMAGLRLQWNLWDGHETSGKVAGAGAQLALAEEWERKTRLEIDLQVSQARLALREASERMEVTQTAIALAEESVELTRARFEEGRALASQLIDAETALTGARVRRISAEIDQQIAIAAVRRSLGLAPLVTANPQSNSRQP